jgi:hypothetical protein
VGGKQIRVAIDFEDYPSRICHFLEYRGYEAGTAAVVMQLMRTRRSVFDVGANVGYYALLMSRGHPEFRYHLLSCQPFQTG